MATINWGVRKVAGTAALLAVMGIGSALAGTSAAPALAAARSAPPVRAASLGAAPSDQRIRLVLPLRADLAGLERFATAVSTPGSSQYGRYESISTLARRFGAAPVERQRVVSYLRRAGATGVKIDVTGLFADATLRVSHAQSLFGTALAEFRTARAGRFTAPSAPTRIPAALRSSITGVVGLDTRPVFGSSHAELSAGAKWPRMAARAAPADVHNDDESGYLERTGVAGGCPAATSQSGFTPNQYLTAYNYSPLQTSGLEGQGERVALIEIDGFRDSDLRAFAKCFGLPTPTINGYGVGLKHPLAPGGESTLDLEVLDAAAPKLRAVDVYESQPNAVDVLQSLTAPLTNSGSKPDVISASLGSCEPATVAAIGNSGLRAVEGSLALAAASGISVLASSGDDGSSACLTPDGKPLPGQAVSYPASSPFVTGVGGTNFSLNAANQIVSQEVWNDAPLVAAAGGGGLSRVFSRPSYQNSFVALSHRAVPDVSMLADIAPGYEIFCTAKSDCITQQHQSPWTQVGGTSAASPLLAGGLALVDQDLRNNGRQDLGLANPLLYQIAHSTLSPNVLSDVVANNNDIGTMIDGQPSGCCTAATGYDEASGLGSVDLAGLAFVAVQTVPKIVSVGLSLPTQRQPVTAEHLLARVSCSGKCLLGAYTRIQVGRARRALVKESSIYLERRAGRKTIRIPFDHQTLTALRGALQRGERITATIYGAILDPSGNIEAQSAGQKLRIRH